MNNNITKLDKTELENYKTLIKGENINVLDEFVNNIADKQKHISNFLVNLVKSYYDDEIDFQDEKNIKFSKKIFEINYKILYDFFEKNNLELAKTTNITNQNTDNFIQDISENCNQMLQSIINDSNYLNKKQNTNTTFNEISLIINVLLCDIKDKLIEHFKNISSKSNSQTSYLKNEISDSKNNIQNQTKYKTSKNKDSVQPKQRDIISNKFNVKQNTSSSTFEKYIRDNKIFVSKLNKSILLKKANSNTKNQKILNNINILEKSFLLKLSENKNLAKSNFFTKFRSNLKTNFSNYYINIKNTFSNKKEKIIASFNQFKAFSENRFEKTKLFFSEKIKTFKKFFKKSFLKIRISIRKISKKLKNFFINLPGRIVKTIIKIPLKIISFIGSIISGLFKVCKFITVNVFKLLTNIIKVSLKIIKFTAKTLLKIVKFFLSKKMLKNIISFSTIMYVLGDRSILRVLIGIGVTIFKGAYELISPIINFFKNDSDDDDSNKEKPPKVKIYEAITGFLRTKVKTLATKVKKYADFFKEFLKISLLNFVKSKTAAIGGALAGAAIGGAFFGPIGAVLGATIGSVAVSTIFNRFEKERKSLNTGPTDVASKIEKHYGLTNFSKTNPLIESANKLDKTLSNSTKSNLNAISKKLPDINPNGNYSYDDNSNALTKLIQSNDDNSFIKSDAYKEMSSLLTNENNKLTSDAFSKINNTLTSEKEFKETAEIIKNDKDNFTFIKNLDTFYNEDNNANDYIIDKINDDSNYKFRFTVKLDADDKKKYMRQLAYNIVRSQHIVAQMFDAINEQIIKGIKQAEDDDYIASLGWYEAFQIHQENINGLNDKIQTGIPDWWSNQFYEVKNETGLKNLVDPESGLKKFFNEFFGKVEITINNENKKFVGWWYKVFHGDDSENLTLKNEFFRDFGTNTIFNNFKLFEDLRIGLTKNLGGPTKYLVDFDKYNSYIQTANSIYTDNINDIDILKLPENVSKKIIYDYIKNNPRKTYLTSSSNSSSWEDFIWDDIKEILKNKSESYKHVDNFFDKVNTNDFKLESFDLSNFSNNQELVLSRLNEELITILTDEIIDENENKKLEKIINYFSDKNDANLKDIVKILKGILENQDDKSYLKQAKEQTSNFLGLVYDLKNSKENQFESDLYIETEKVTNQT